MQFTKKYIFEFALLLYECPILSVLLRSLFFAWHTDENFTVKNIRVHLLHTIQVSKLDFYVLNQAIFVHVVCDTFVGNLIIPLTNFIT
jgi:hypothetical protein